MSYRLLLGALVAIISAKTPAAARSIVALRRGNAKCACVDNNNNRVECDGEVSNKLLTILMMELKHPQVQVVVMSANMGCSLCRQRVANVVSKMNGEHQIKSNQIKIVVHSV
jgi:hypothetical protein